MSDIVTYPLDLIEYNAADAAGYFSGRQSGVYSADEDFTVTPSTGTTLSVSAGRAWVHPTRFTGYSIIQQSAESVPLPMSDTDLPRIDRLVLRFDATARKTTLAILQGTPASSPTPPTISRTSLVYDLCLCQVTRRAGSTVITTQDIADTRLNESLCGVMRDGVTGIPTTALQQQASAVMQSIVNTANALFDSYTGGYRGAYTLTLAPESWKSATGTFPYQCLAALTAAKADAAPSAAVVPDSYAVARAAGLANVCETLDNQIRFWARAKPTKAITVQVVLLGPDESRTKERYLVLDGTSVLSTSE